VTRLGHRAELDPALRRTARIEPTYLVPEAEIAMGPAYWLLGLPQEVGTGRFLSSAGSGIDSCATAVISFLDVSAGLSSN